MSNMDSMKTLLEAVDKVEKIKVGEPTQGYANTPKEQTLDMKTMNDNGNDLHKKKNAQFRSKEGDNPMAMTPVKVKQVQERLEREYNEFLKESEK